MCVLYLCRDADQGEGRRERRREDVLEQRPDAVIVDGDPPLRLQERERMPVTGAVDDGVGDDARAVDEHHPPVLAQAIDLRNANHMTFFGLRRQQCIPGLCWQ